METTFKKSETITNLAKAMMEFQKEVKAVQKNGENPHFKSSFATLDDIVAAIKEPMAKAKLSYVQMPTGENQLVTILMHETGEYMESTVKMKPTKDDPQGQGSAITYMRRYSLSAMLGLATEEDDDGNGASAAAKTKAPAVGKYFEQAKKNIEKNKDKEALKVFKTKMVSSDKYSKEEKDQLSKILDTRIKELK